MKVEVEDEAVGVLLVSGDFSHVVDILADILHHVQPFRLRLSVRSSVKFSSELRQFYLFAVVTAVDMEDIFPPSKCLQMVLGSMKSRPWNRKRNGTH